MSGSSPNGWMPVLSRLNSNLFATDRWKKDLTQTALITGWCGQSPATESDILEAEARLGIKLPPSYRSFLSMSNGWRPFSSFIEWLLPVQKIERYGAADPEDLALLQACYVEYNVSDADYLDYATPEHNAAIRHRYFNQSLLIGKQWTSGGGELLLLNPHIVFPNGEWETVFFANWIPGNWRYPSFRAFVEESIDDQEGIEGRKCIP